MHKRALENTTVYDCMSNDEIVHELLIILHTADSNEAEFTECLLRTLKSSL